MNILAVDIVFSAALILLPLSPFLIGYFAGRTCR